MEPLAGLRCLPALPAIMEPVGFSTGQTWANPASATANDKLLQRGHSYLPAFEVIRECHCKTFVVLKCLDPLRHCWGHNIVDC
jgi:hypothetical protein